MTTEKNSPVQLIVMICGLIEELKVVQSEKNGPQKHCFLKMGQEQPLHYFMVLITDNVATSRTKLAFQGS